MFIDRQFSYADEKNVRCSTPLSSAVQSRTKAEEAAGLASAVGAAPGPDCSPNAALPLPLLTLTVLWSRSASQLSLGWIAVCLPLCSPRLRAPSPDRSACRREQRRSILLLWLQLSATLVSLADLRCRLGESESLPEACDVRLARSKRAPHHSPEAWSSGRWRSEAAAGRGRGSLAAVRICPRSARFSARSEGSGTEE